MAPENLEVIFTENSARLTWQPPAKGQGQMSLLVHYSKEVRAGFVGALLGLKKLLLKFVKH
jgi:hypothetical protein